MNGANSMACSLERAVAWPLAARAQQPAIAGDRRPRRRFAKRVRESPGGVPSRLSRTLGYVEGQNVAIEYRFAEGRFDRLPSLADDLVRRRVAVMVSTGVGSSLAAKNASSTIPHVFLSQDDPVKLGLVASFNRPGGNATGVSLLTAELAAKRVELARQIMPAGAPLAYLVNPTAPEAARYLQEIETVARSINHEDRHLQSQQPGRDRCRIRDLVANSGPECSSSVPTAISSAAATRSSRWRRATKSPQSMSSASLRRPVAS